MEPADSCQKITISVQKFNIKQPSPSYDLLYPIFKTRYDIQAWNELIASLNYAIGSYTNDVQNRSWNDQYLAVARLQIAMTVVGPILLILSEILILIGYEFGMGSELVILGYVCLALSILCACSFGVFFLKMGSMKRTHFFQNVRPLIENALGLLNSKYRNQCMYSIDKIDGAQLFDLSTSVQIKIKIKLLAQNVYYVNNNQMDGDGPARVVQVTVPHIMANGEGADNNSTALIGQAQR